jgi:hypothetical protein
MLVPVPRKSNCPETSRNIPGMAVVNGMEPALWGGEHAISPAYQRAI